MKKRGLVSVLGAAVLLLLAACNVPFLPNDGAESEPETGSLSIILPQIGPVSRSIAPGSSDPVDYFVIKLSGPGASRTVTVDAGAGEARIDDLVPGMWTIGVIGKHNVDGGDTSPDDPTVVIGSSSVKIERGRTTTSAITVKRVTGDGTSGTLVLSVAWETVLSDPSVTASLDPVGPDAVLDLPLILDNPLGEAGSAAYDSSSSGDLEAGYYTLSVRLENDGILLWGIVDTVRIIDGALTAADFDLVADDLDLGGASIEVIFDPEDPMVIGFDPEPLAVVNQGDTLSVTATVPELVGDQTDTYLWYLDGVLLTGETGPTLDLAIPAEDETGEPSPGPHQVHVIVERTSGDDGLVGSAGFEFDVVALGDQRPFITTWQTNAPGATNTSQLRLPLESAGTYDFVVDWGDGSQDTITSYNQAEATKTYMVPGTYDVTITGQIEGFSFSGSSEASKFLDVKQWGNVKLGNNGNQFANTRNLEGFSAVDVPDLSNLTNANRMFANATYFTADLTNWDMSNVTTMDSMFSFAESFSGDISGWDVSNVTRMSSLFYYASDFNGDIGSWDVSSATDMRQMFYEARTFAQDLSSWDVSSVTNMDSMFWSADSFDSDIGGWNVSSVTTMRSMFYGAERFNADLSGWDVSSVTTMRSMFALTSRFNSDISGWDVSGVTDMDTMFSSARNFNQPIGAWDVSGVTSMNSMFSGASSFNQPLAAWDVSSVTSMSGMFSGTSEFNQPLEDWDVSAVRNMGSMFSSARKFNQPLNEWDTSAVTSMWSMFSNADAFDQDLSGLETGAATNMNSMFFSADAFNGSVAGWDVSNVTSMNSMFSSARMFNQDLTSWDVSAVTDFSSMFSNATEFNGDVTGWTPTAARWMNSMFNNARAFDQDLSGWCVPLISSTPSFFGNGASIAGFPQWGGCTTP